MYTENLITELVEFDKAWIDKYGLVSGAYAWAVDKLPPGQRVIGIRVLPFNGKLDIYKFDIRHHSDKGVTVECEMPARCSTVVRVNQRQMLVQETQSGEIVQKYLPFVVHGKPEWRLWHKRTYEYHLETSEVAVNYNIFLLQCNEIVRPLAKAVGERDWFHDMKRRVMFTDLRANTPVAVHSLLGNLRGWINEHMRCAASDSMAPADLKKAHIRYYIDLLDTCTNIFIDAKAGTSHSR